MISPLLFLAPGNMKHGCLLNVETSKNRALGGKGMLSKFNNLCEFYDENELSQDPITQTIYFWGVTEQLTSCRFHTEWNSGSKQTNKKNTNKQTQNRFQHTLKIAVNHDICGSASTCSSNTCNSNVVGHTNLLGHIDASHSNYNSGQCPLTEEGCSASLVLELVSIFFSYNHGICTHPHIHSYFCTRK